MTNDDTNSLNPSNNYHHLRYRTHFLWDLTGSIFTAHDRPGWDGDRLRLILGFLDEGIWCFEDGDEGFIRGTYQKERGPLKLPMQVLDQVAGRLPAGEAGHVYATAQPAMRLAIIAWLAWTSRATTELNALRGFRAREHVDLRSLIDDWFRLLPPSIGAALHEDGVPEDAYQSFIIAMDDAGHACHRVDNLGDGFRTWLRIRSVLRPEVSHAAVSLHGEAECRACVSSSVPNELPSPSRRLPRYLALLYILFDHLNAQQQRQLLTPQHFQRLSQSSATILSPFRHQTLQAVEACLSDLLPKEPASFKLQSWLNEFPLQWRPHIQKYPPSLWVRTLTFLEASHLQEPPTRKFQPDLGSWIAASLICITGLTDVPTVVQFRDTVGTFVSLPSIPNPTTLAFCTEVRTYRAACSGWSKLSQDDIEWYAGGMALLLDRVSLVCASGDKCLPCLLDERIHDFTQIRLQNPAQNDPEAFLLKLFETHGSYPSTTPAKVNDGTRLLRHIWSFVCREDWGVIYSAFRAASQRVSSDSSPAFISSDPTLIWEDLPPSIPTPSPIKFVTTHTGLIPRAIAFSCPGTWLMLQRAFVKHDFPEVDRWVRWVDEKGFEVVSAPYSVAYVYSLCLKVEGSELVGMIQNVLALARVPFLVSYQTLLSKILDFLHQYPKLSTFTSPQTLTDMFNLDVGFICATITLVLQNRQDQEDILNLSKSDAQTVLDLLQQVVDFPDLDPWFRAQCTKLLIRLSKSSCLYPKSLEIPPSTLHKTGAFAVTSGSYGDVWRGKLRGQNVAVKVIKVYEDSVVKALLQAFHREALIWSQLMHPNVLPFYGIYLEQGRRLGLVSPWMEKGNLPQFLKCSSFPVNRCAIVFDISQGIKYLHEQYIIHGDLKGVNIVMSPNDTPCIADFGLSVILTESAEARHSLTSSAGTAAGTVRWQAPELFRGERNSLASDMFAFACLCYEVFAGCLPHAHLARDVAVMLSVLEGNRDGRPTSPELHDAIWDVMQACWHQQPSERPEVALVANILSMVPRVAERIPWSSASQHWKVASSTIRISLRQEVLCPSITAFEGILRDPKRKDSDASMASSSSGSSSGTGSVRHGQKRQRRSNSAPDIIMSPNATPLLIDEDSFDLLSYER